MENNVNDNDGDDNNDDDELSTSYADNKPPIPLKFC